jgi:hypothetical protein
LIATITVLSYIGTAPTAESAGCLPVTEDARGEALTRSGAQHTRAGQPSSRYRSAGENETRRRPGFTLVVDRLRRMRPSLGCHASSIWHPRHEVPVKPTRRFLVRSVSPRVECHRREARDRCLVARLGGSHDPVVEPVESLTRTHVADNPAGLLPTRPTIQRPPPGLPDRATSGPS